MWAPSVNKTIRTLSTHHPLYSETHHHYSPTTTRNIRHLRVEHPVSLETGVVLTVEPGLYISDRLPVPEGQPTIEERWKGIGIRIEADVAVVDGGAEVLTAAALKSMDAMER